MQAFVASNRQTAVAHENLFRSNSVEELTADVHQSSYCPSAVDPSQPAVGESFLNARTTSLF